MEFLKQWKGRRVLITGGTGFIGGHVLEQGIQGHVNLHSLSLRQSASASVPQHHVNLIEREEVFHVINDIRPEAIIHLATAGVTYGSVGLAEMLKANVLGTENLLAAAAALESRPAIVIGGTGYEYAPQDRPISEDDPVAPISPYAVTKAAAALCAGYYAAKMPITLLRLFSIYGPVEKPPRLVPYLIESAKAGRDIELTGCEQVRDFTYVEEAAESFWRVLSVPSRRGGLRVLNVGTGTAVQLREFVTKVLAKLKQKGIGAKALLGAKPYRADEPMMFMADVNALRATLGWVPTVSIDEGIDRMVEAIL